MEKDAGTVSVDVNQTAATYESLITPERVERPDHIPVFAEEEDGYYGGKSKFNAHKKYVPKISYRHFSLPFRRRELVVLCSGCLLMCIALTLIVTGAIRVHGCSCPVSDVITYIPCVAMFGLIDQLHFLLESDQRRSSVVSIHKIY